MTVNSLSIQMIIQVKITAVRFAKLSASGFNYDPGRCKILKGFIGNDGCISPAHSYIAYVGSRAAQCPHFSREQAVIMKVKPGIREQEAFIVDCIQR